MMGYAGLLYGCYYGGNYGYHNPWRWNRTDRVGNNERLEVTVILWF